MQQSTQPVHPVSEHEPVMQFSSDNLHLDIWLTTSDTTDEPEYELVHYRLTYDINHQPRRSVLLPPSELEALSELVVKAISWMDENPAAG